MKKRKGPSPSLSVEFDRWLASARAKGNQRLVEHMERIRPRLHLESNDAGEVHARAAHQFGRDCVEIGKTIGADPFDMILMMAGACAHVLNELQLEGLNYWSATHALTSHLNDLANRIGEEMLARAKAEREKHRAPGAEQADG